MMTMPDELDYDDDDARMDRMQAAAATTDELYKQFQAIESQLRGVVAETPGRVRNKNQRARMLDAIQEAMIAIGDLDLHFSEAWSATHGWGKL